MNRKIIIVIILLWCFIAKVKPQDSIPFKSQHLIGISSGLSRNIIRNEIVSPLIYKGINTPIDLSYCYLGVKSRQSFSLNYSDIKLESSISNKWNNFYYYTQSKNVLIQYSYLRKLYTLPQYNLDFYMGGTLKSFLNYMDHYFIYHGNNQSMPPALDQINSLDINIIIEKKNTKLKNDILHFTIDVPLVAYVLINNMYNSYNGESIDKLDLTKNMNNIIWQVIKDGNIITVNKLIEFQTEISYIKFVSPYIGFEFKHQLFYYSLNKYKDLYHSNYLNYQLLLGVILKL